jgi:hypothetical protein
LLIVLTVQGLAAAAPGVKTFGEESTYSWRPLEHAEICEADFITEQIYWREASAGHSRSAYFAGKVLSTFPRLCVSAIHFTTFYYVLSTPLMAFWRMYAVNLMYFYCTFASPPSSHFGVQTNEAKAFMAWRLLCPWLFGVKMGR